jgi:hypothetical protein
LLVVGLLKLRWVLLLLLLLLLPMVVVRAVLLLVLRVVLLRLVLVLRAVLLLVLLRLVLVMALVPGRVVADIVVSLTIISLIVREYRKGRSTRTPVVGLAMRSWRRDYFLASMVESPETTLRRGREATRVGVRGRYRTARWCRPIIVVARFLVLASTSFFVSTSLFETQKSCNVAVITRPTPRAKKVVAATSAAASPRLV